MVRFNEDSPSSKYLKSKYTAYPSSSASSTFDFITGLGDPLFAKELSISPSFPNPTLLNDSKFSEPSIAPSSIKSSV